MNIWTKLLITKEPSNLSAHDWKELRRMAAQVSDVAVTTRPMRLAVLVHGVASFFYNTCILALAINAAVTVGI